MENSDNSILILMLIVLVMISIILLLMMIFKNIKAKKVIKTTKNRKYPVQNDEVNETITSSHRRIERRIFKTVREEIEVFTEYSLDGEQQVEADRLTPQVLKRAKSEEKRSSIQAGNESDFISAVEKYRNLMIRNGIPENVLNSLTLKSASAQDKKKFLDTYKIQLAQIIVDTAGVAISLLNIFLKL